MYDSHVIAFLENIYYSFSYSLRPYYVIHIGEEELWCRTML